MEFKTFEPKKLTGRPSRHGLSQTRAAFRRAKIDVGFESDKLLQEAYPDILNFYTDPPNYSVSLEEFEQYAVERLKMLRLIERVNQTDTVKYTTDYFSGIQREIRKAKDVPTYYKMLYPSSKNEIEDENETLNLRKIDHISHFLLRLAYARTDEQRKWFIALEVDFFRYKLWEMRNLASVLKRHNLPYVEVSDDEKMKFLAQISNASFQFHHQAPTGHLELYKVHFGHALDLVRNRKVFLYKGYAYVPTLELSGVIALKFRSHLSESLSLLKKNIHLIEEDERLRPMVFGFEKRYLGRDATVVKSGDAVSVAELSGFAEKSFPLCMKHLYDVVLKDHHLKHWGRLQLGLFFKGLGLPVDEATKFWRSNFTKRPDIDSNRFDKQYLYNIRHMYGQEGKRTDYTPYSCMKIINSNVGPGDHHGCPFRHSDATPLRAKLQAAGIPQDGAREIMKLVDAKHFQLACQRYFELTHDGWSVDGGVHHPNQYFMESRNVLTGKKTIKQEASDKPTTRTLIYKDGSQRTVDSTESSSAPQKMETMDDDDDDEILLASMDIDYS